MEDLKGISSCLDGILDKPAEKWSQKEINIYHILKKTLEKYQVRYSMAQFRLDIRDIKSRVQNTSWFLDSKYQKTLNWLLDQLVIKNYQHSRSRSNYKIICRLTETRVLITIIHKDKNFQYIIHGEETGVKCGDLSQFDKMALIFGVKNDSPDGGDKDRNRVITDISKLIVEIAMYYG